MADNLETEAERLGRAVQLRRVEMGIKRPEFAKRAELSYPYVSEIENGIKTPSNKALGQLARALELSPAELIGLAEKLEPPASDASVLVDHLLPDRTSGHRLEAARQSGSMERSSAPLFEEHRSLPSPMPLDVRELEDVVARIVRAEIAAWAHTELPRLIRAEVERAINNERGGESPPHPGQGLS